MIHNVPEGLQFSVTGLRPQLLGVGLVSPSMQTGLPGFAWQRMTIVKRANVNNPLPPGAAVVMSEDAVPLARQIRSTVAAAVRGVATS